LFWLLRTLDLLFKCTHATWYSHDATMRMTCIRLGVAVWPLLLHLVQSGTRRVRALLTAVPSDRRIS
jgi:hypothetical protein